jgi:DnaJ like chaperone protein
MNWLGKVVGGACGFLVGGPLGSVVGAAIGHQIDRRTQQDGLFFPRLDPHARQKVQQAFFTATFSVLGHVAKADGRVTEAEIQAARRVMNRLVLSEEQRHHAIQLFGEGKSADFPLDDTLDRFIQECRHNYTLIRMFMEVQLEAALADGALHETEERLLLQICDRLKFSRFEFHVLRAALEAQMRMAGERGAGYTSSGNTPRQVTKDTRLADAYTALGVKPAASPDEITRAYRKMMSQHHPDKLVASGLPEQMVKLATEKTQQIRKAYELIREERKF